MRLLVLFFMASSVWAKDPTCVKDLAGIRMLFNDTSMPIQWDETTANDGKPLLVDIGEKDGRLFLQFIKTKEGLWAEGTAKVCKGQDGITAEITKKDIKLGEAAPWILRMSMKGGATFKLLREKADKLHISTFGWGGDFVPRTPVTASSQN